MKLGSDCENVEFKHFYNIKFVFKDDMHFLLLRNYSNLLHILFKSTKFISEVCQHYCRLPYFQCYILQGDFVSKLKPLQRNVESHSKVPQAGIQAQTYMRPRD